MDVFTLSMGLTLLAAGWFMLRDYVRFLTSGYIVKGSVVAIQQSSLHGYSNLVQQIALANSAEHISSETSYSSDKQYSIYPVIEYLSNGEAVRFTMISGLSSDQYHVGDAVDLRFCRSRRVQGRISRSTVSLITMLTVLSIGLAIGAVFSSVGLTIAHICFSSIILTFCLFIMAAYYCNRDENSKAHYELGRRGRMRVLILEPSAFKHWGSMIDDKTQKRRIFGSQVFGAGCLMSGMAIIASVFLIDTAYAAYEKPLSFLHVVTTATQ